MKLIITEESDTSARTESGLLGHIQSHNLRYFGHVMRRLFDNIESSMMTGL